MLILVFSFFVLLIPPPPRSTLFPYTTLFRSRLHVLPGHVRPARVAVRRERFHPLLHADVTAGNALEADRKSTRLNSSHRTISYAVFCLKKKNTKAQKNACSRRRTSLRKHCEN